MKKKDTENQQREFRCKLSAKKKHLGGGGGVQDRQLNEVQLTVSHRLIQFCQSLENRVRA